MIADIVLNELSFKACAVDDHAARKRMTTLMETLEEAERYIQSPNLHFHEEVWHCPWSGYYLQQWIRDPLVDADDIRRFLGYHHKTPLCSDSPELRDYQYGVEYRLNGDVAFGLGAAHQLEALAVSITSSPQWEFGQLQITFTELPDIDEAQVVEIRHACRPSHVNEHEPWFFDR